MEAEFKLKDFTEIYALCSRRTDSFCIIGDHFCQIFQGRDIVSVCLTLIASYQECDSIICVTQRLIIVYLLYRLKEVGNLAFENKDENKPEIFVHPFLMIFVKVYSDFLLATSNGQNKLITVEPNLSAKGIVHLLGNFPKITPQEANFVARILTEPFSSLAQLFNLSPAQIADNPVSNFQDNIDISKQMEYVESQLDQFRVFGREGFQDNLCDAKGTSSLPVIDPLLLNHFARIVYSIIPPPFVRIEPSVMPPCEDEFCFIYPSLLEPEQIVNDCLKDEEWNREKMRSLDKALGSGSSSLRIALHSSAPPSPNRVRKQQFTPDISYNSTTYGAGPELATTFSKSSPVSQAPTLHNILSSNMLMPRSQAADCLKKIVLDSANSLSKADITRLALTVSTDPEVFKDANIGDYFSKLIENQPDIAAELMLYEMISDSNSLALHCEVLLELDFSVQSLVAVNKFISSCESKQLKIPEDFLNRFITYCMAACDQNGVNELLSQNRLVRMVCVFFAMLIRLKNFDVKPRLTEMQNFSTIFSSFKEASTLYQSILQIN